MSEEVENVEESEEPIEEETTEDEVQEEEAQEEEGTEEKEEPELEDWQKEEDAAEEDNGIVYPKSLKAKKRLKGELAEKNDELERLRLENEALKNKKAVNTPTALKIPEQIDFDTEEEFNAAMVNYTVAKVKEEQSQAQEQEKQKQAIEQIQKSVDLHYERAETLMESSGISPEKYKTADTRFRQTIEAVFPKLGDATADLMLSRLGEGSEKVGYYIGNNETARLKLQSLLVEDPSGISAAMYLGAEKNRLNNNNPRKKTSNAQPPVKTISGDVAVNSKDAALKKKYQEAAKKPGKEQEAYDIRKKARKAGVDVSKWD